MNNELAKFAGLAVMPDRTMSGGANGSNDLVTVSKRERK